METERNASPGGEAVEMGKPEARLLVYLCRSHTTVKIISAFEKYRLKSSHPPDLNGLTETHSEPAASTAVPPLANTLPLREKKDASHASFP